MSKLTTVKIKYDNGNLSGQIPIGMEAENVYWNNQETLKDKLGNLDSDSRDVESRLEDAATRIQELEDADYETKISTAQNGIISLTNKLNNLPYITITSSNHIQKTDKTKIYKENGFLYYWGNGEWQKIRVSDAVGIKNITAGDNYSFNFELTDGRIFNTGSLRGAPGQDVGQKGVGIADVHHNEDNTLTFYFTGNIRVGQQAEETNQFTTGSIQGPKGLGIKTIQVTPNTSNSLRFIYDEYSPDRFGEANFVRIDDQRYSFQDVPIYIEGGGGTSGGGSSVEVVSISEIRPNQTNTGFSIYLTNDPTRPAFQSGNLKGEDGVGITDIQWIQDEEAKKLQITLSNGTTVTSDSLVGPAGENGRGISNASFNTAQNTLTLNFDKPLDNGNTSYTTPPIGGSGLASINYAVPANYISEVSNFDGSDYTQVFEVMLADAKQNQKIIIIPPGEYNLDKPIWTDDSIVMSNTGSYPNHRLIVSKALRNSPPFERGVVQFNPADNNQNYGTVLWNLTKYRVQGVCYDDLNDLFVFAFCGVKDSADNDTEPLYLLFYRLKQDNDFEFKGSGVVNFGGHGNSLCFRVEKNGNKSVGCVYIACGSRPITSSLTTSQVGGGYFQVARVPIIPPSSSSGNYSIPAGENHSEVVKQNDPNHGNKLTPVNYAKIQYFCNVTCDSASINRKVFRIGYDKINDIFYLDYTLTKASSGYTENRARLKPFILNGNEWINCDPNLKNNITTGIVKSTECKRDVKDLLGIFKDIPEGTAEFSDAALKGLDQQAITVINQQVIQMYYISNSTQDFYRYNNGIIMGQFDYNTGRIKRIYRLPVTTPSTQPQCIVEGKNGKIYLINDVGNSETNRQKRIRVTQLVFNDKVIAQPENPYSDPKDLRTYYIKDLTKITEPGCYIFGPRRSFTATKPYNTYTNSNNITYQGCGENITSANNVELQIEECGLLNVPTKRYYFTLYVFPLINKDNRFLVAITRHGQIYTRTLYFAGTQTGGVSGYGWKQLAETGATNGASRKGKIYTAGFLAKTTGTVRTLHFNVPFATNNIPEERLVPSISSMSLALRQEGKTFSIGDILTYNKLQSGYPKVEVEGWGYHVIVQLAEGNSFIDSTDSNNIKYFEMGAVGIYSEIRIVFGDEFLKPQ